MDTNTKLIVDRIISFAVMFFALVLLSMLITYNTLHVSLNSTDFIREIGFIYVFRNYFADALLQTFGIAIYIIPVILIIYSYLIFTGVKIKNIFGKTVILITLLLLVPINVYLYLDVYKAGIIGAFLVNYLPFINILAILLLVVNVALFFMAVGLPFSNYKKMLVNILEVIVAIIDMAKNILPKKKSSRQEFEEEITITPDLNYIEEDIARNNINVNLKEYSERNKGILKNNLFLKVIHDINEQNNLSSEKAEEKLNLYTNTKAFNNTTDEEIERFLNLKTPSNTATKEAGAAQDLEIETPTGNELARDRSSMVKKLFKNYSIPLSFLKVQSNTNVDVNKAEISKNAANLEKVMSEFGILGKIVNIVVGPVVTMYEITIPAGMKATKLTSLETDIALRMSAISVRIAVVAGKDVIGIELPNTTRKMIYLKEIIQSAAFENSGHQLPITLGLDTAGKPIIEDLSTMPHALIAGTTGSGKSVGINTIILSLLYKFSPEQCKLIMIDPKMLELSVYQDIPHLITPVVTDPKKAVSALKWAVREMDIRYNLMSLLGVRNIVGYNEKIKDTSFVQQKLATLPQDQQAVIEFNFMPYIAVIIDEMADLMLVAGKDVEIAVQRLAQKARAAGIHVIMATQRPSTDVITGTIKANFPTRISFKVSSSIDSRTILNSNGAERLLGKGDMLYLSGLGLKRVHGPFVSDDEVIKVADYLKSLGKPNYVSEIISTPISMNEDGEDGEDDELVQKAIEVIQLTGKVSVSHLQNKLRIGFNKSTRLVDLLEAKGIVGPDKGAGKRDVFIK